MYPEFLTAIFLVWIPERNWIQFLTPNEYTPLVRLTKGFAHTIAVFRKPNKIDLIPFIRSSIILVLVGSVSVLTLLFN